MADDNRTGGARVLPGVIVRAVVNDNQQVNARDCTACAYGRGDLAANIVGADDRSDLLGR
jgi:hypothetical protein